MARTPFEPACSAAPLRLCRLGPLLVVVAAAAMLIWSWRTWPDPLIDFGQQLYVSWRLVEGDALYRDVAYLYGPLSPWINAGLFRLFGVGLITLVAGNLVILSGVILLLWRLLVAVGSCCSATVAGVTFVTVFAFGQLVEFGNYNFVCPYSHGVTHGVALSLLALYLLALYQRRSGTLLVAGLGLAVGLLFLTKAELFLAGAAAVVCGLALTWRHQRLPRERLLRHCASFAGCALLPPLLAFALLWTRMPASQALVGLLGTWPEILGGEVAQNPFYRWSLGTQGLGHSLVLMRKSIVWYGLLLAPPAALGLLLRRPGRHRFGLAVATFVAIAGYLAWRPVWWPATVGLLPVAMLLLGLWLAAGLIRRRRLDESAPRRILALALVLFALVALFKILFLARTYHYGFALAMPATLLAIVALLDWIPARIERAGGYGGPLRAAALAVCAFFVLGHLNETRHYFALKTEIVATGRDAFRADERGRSVNEMLALIERSVGPDDSLAVLPAGVMLNYLSRRAAPTPYIYFMPSDLRMQGEEEMLARFRSTPPDFVLLVHKDTSEFGARFFGREYGRALHDWVLRNYRVAGQVGAPPLRDERFGMTLLERDEAELPGGG